MIEVQNLTKKFNGKTILNGINFHVHKGEIFGFLGPNGAGKTTTLRIILGLLDPTSGEALVFGEDIGSNGDLRRKVGILLENDGLYDGLSAYENLDYYAQLYNVPDRDKKIRNLLDFAGLLERKGDKVGTFSKGMKRKLGLARAMIHDPDVLFLDEPSSGLDPEAQRMVRDLILHLAKEKRTIFLNSHDLDEVQKICSKIAILHKGTIQAYDKVENLRNTFSNPVFEIILTDAANAKSAFDLLQSLDYVSDCKLDGLGITATLKEENYSNILNELVGNGIKVEEAKKLAKSLEDVYLDVVKGE
ncbi:MAG: ABC-2 type transport system ATP-binding protein [Candidatus Methanocomedens sp.]|jgi:ABC-2 type transport system ATP-binding protein|nr:MAG: ABC-2 type transport system ATP-binding protein [ANME-2 cluster archaeon]MBT9439221.1 ATP-binding cassette domain-containing protein [Desulfobacterales bacterium]